MDAITSEIITWDMGHLTLQQVAHLHALKNLAQKEIYLKLKKEMGAKP